MSYKKYLEKIYFDISHPASFSGVDKLYRTVKNEGKINLSKVNPCPAEPGYTMPLQTV